RAPKLGEGDTVYAELTYQEGDKYSRSTNKVLDSDNNSTRWTFGIYDRGAGKLAYKGSFDFKDGRSLQIPLTAARSDMIDLNPNAGVATVLNVAIDPSLLDWSSGLQIVQVEVTYATKKQTETFRAGSVPASPPVKSWEIVEGSTSYTWKIVYFVK